MHTVLKKITDEIQRCDDRLDELDNGDDELYRLNYDLQLGKRMGLILAVEIIETELKTCWMQRLLTWLKKLNDL